MHAIRRRSGTRQELREKKGPSDPYAVAGREIQGGKERAISRADPKTRQAASLRAFVGKKKNQKKKGKEG